METHPRMRARPKLLRAMRLKVTILAAKVLGVTMTGMRTGKHASESSVSPSAVTDDVLIEQADWPGLFASKPNNPRPLADIPIMLSLPNYPDA